MFKRTHLVIGLGIIAMMLLAPMAGSVVTAQSGKGKAVETKSQKSRGEGKDEPHQEQLRRQRPENNNGSPACKGRQKDTWRILDSRIRQLHFVQNSDLCQW